MLRWGRRRDESFFSSIMSAYLFLGPSRNCRTSIYTFYEASINCYYFRLSQPADSQAKKKCLQASKVIHSSIIMKINFLYSFCSSSAHLIVLVMCLWEKIEEYLMHFPCNNECTGREVSIFISLPFCGPSSYSQVNSKNLKKIIFHFSSFFCSSRIPSTNNFYFIWCMRQV